MDKYFDAEDCMKTWKCSSKFPGLKLDIITYGQNIDWLIDLYVRVASISLDAAFALVEKTYLRTVNHPNTNQTLPSIYI